MRTLALLLTFLSALALCIPLSAQPPSGERATLQDTALCVERAQRETDLVPGQIRRLCIATPSPSGPVACFVEADHTLDLTDQQNVELCRCSTGVEPARCVHALRDRELLTDPQMVDLCSPTVTLGLRADCTPIR